MNLRDEMMAIREEHGRLTPEIVVEAARPKSHPLHDRVFDRRPADAAEAYYRLRAHELIRSVMVSYRKPGKPSESVRAFHAVRDDQGYAYQPAEEVAADPFTRSLVLRDMERDWQQLRARYEQFAEFTEMVRRDLEGGIAV